MTHKPTVDGIHTVKPYDKEFGALKNVWKDGIARRFGSKTIDTDFSKLSKQCLCGAVE